MPVMATTIHCPCPPNPRPQVAVSVILQLNPLISKQSLLKVPFWTYHIILRTQLHSVVITQLAVVQIRALTLSLFLCHTIL